MYRLRQEIEREEYRYRRYSLQDQREIWELDALRISDIIPDDHIRGLIFFPNNPDAMLYKVTLELGKKALKHGSGKRR